MSTSTAEERTGPEVAPQPIDLLVHARSVVLWMAQGVMPSAENAQRARRGIEQVMHELSHEDPSPAADLADARRVVGFISMGVAPSRDACFSAGAQINLAMDAVREHQQSSASLRQRFERSR